MGTFGGILIGAAIGFLGGMLVQKNRQPNSPTKQDTVTQQSTKSDFPSSVNRDTISTESNTTTTKTANQNVAKKAFLDNIKAFAPKLNTLLDGSYNGNAWTEEIININSNDLTTFWKQIYRDSNAVLRILSMWGIKPDACTSFVANETYQSMYTKSDGTPISLNERYNVAKQCWILTQTNDENKVVKSVLAKGEVE